MTKEIEELKEKVEREGKKVAQAEEIKKLNKELLRLQHQNIAKVADLAKDLPKMLWNGLACLGNVTVIVVEGLNKMDEKVVEMQRKETEAKGNKQTDELGDLIKEL